MSKSEQLLIDAYHAINELAWDYGDSDTKMESIQNILYQVEQSLDHLTFQSESLTYKEEL